MAGLDPPDDDKVHSLFSEQRREVMAAQSIESDLDLAFHLQLQEALTASLALQPSSSSAAASASSASHDGVPRLSKLEQELDDRIQSETEMRKVREDLNRQIHDQNVAREIARIPEDEWIEWGDNFGKPYGVGCLKKVENGDVFRLYFKGLVSEESVRVSEKLVTGIGVAICDARDNLIFEMSKPFVGNGMNKREAESKALIEGLSAALALELKRINFFCDYNPLYKFITGKWVPKQRKLAALVNQITVLQRNFTYCKPSLVSRKDIKFAFKLARNAIDSHTEPAKSTRDNNLKETCVICLEDTDVSQILSVDSCLHRYCFSCMEQHVEVKLLHGMLPKCPHDGCKSELNVDTCEKFLTPKLIDRMKQQIKEASIPATEKVYCPYPRCSALMSKRDVIYCDKGKFVGSERVASRKCQKCQRLFCIYCKVPWHSNLTCHEYKRLNPHPPAEDVKLKSLAMNKLWRQCVKCNHMIELAEGCYHMTCRCGYQFCYNCGAEWKNKSPTCSCPLWEEGNILREDPDNEEYDDWDDYYDSDDDEDNEFYQSDEEFWF